MNLIMKPTTPMTIMPKKQILIESHSSSLPGFLASFSNFAAELKNDRMPNAAQPSNNN